MSISLLPVPRAFQYSLLGQEPPIGFRSQTNAGEFVLAVSKAATARSCAFQIVVAAVLLGLLWFVLFPKVALVTWLLFRVVIVVAMCLISLFVVVVFAMPVIRAMQLRSRTPAWAVLTTSHALAHVAGTPVGEPVAKLICLEATVGSGSRSYVRQWQVELKNGQRVLVWHSRSILSMNGSEVEKWARDAGVRVERVAVDAANL
jgi:hypothetical protein